MTPVCLECGGKSPVYVDPSADMEITAKRIAWGRYVKFFFLNNQIRF